MGKAISLFTDYSQSENRVTNYCGLMMKLIYEESPRRFSILIDQLTNGEGNLIIGPTFSQQQKEKKSVPDLVIAQSAFTIAFENKLGDWFHANQLDKHLQGLKDKSGTLILFLLSNFDTDPIIKFQSAVAIAREQGVLLIPISYEDFLSSLEAVCTTDRLSGLLDEFREFLDIKNLLPRWKYMLDVVNCVSTMHEIEQGVYICPDNKGSYSHKRARFFGPYENKAVRAIYEIEAVVSVPSLEVDEAKVRWNNTNQKKSEDFRRIAVRKVAALRPDQVRSTALQVFLLGDRAETNFKKGTPKGMQGSKKYFWNVGIGRENVSDLATYLQDKDWQEVQQLTYSTQLL